MVKISSASDAGVAISGAFSSHAETWSKIDSCEDFLLRLRKPFNQAELVKMGYDWAANFSYGKGNSFVEKKIAGNVADVMMSLAFINVFFKPYNKEKHKAKIYLFLQEDRLKNKFALSISRVLADSLEYDTNFYPFLSKIEYNAFVFGHCSVTRDDFSYLGHANHVRCIAYEDRTKLSDVDNWILFDTRKAEQLYRMHQGFKNQSTSLVTDSSGKTYQQYENGWIKDGLIEIFKLALKGKKFSKDENDKGLLEQDVSTWENIEAVINKYGYYTALGNLNNVYVCKIFYIDDVGHFNEVYIAVNGDPTSRNLTQSPGTNEYLLYKKNHGKREQNKVINIIRDYCVNADDFIHTLKGKGKIIAEDDIRFNVKKCSIEDKLKFSGSPHFKQKTAIQGENFKIGVAGGFISTPEGIDLDAIQFNFDLSSHIVSLQQDEQHFGRDSFHYDPSLEGRLSNRPTKNEVEQKGQEVSKQKSTRIPIKTADYSSLFLNILFDLSLKTYKDEKNKRIQDYFYQEILNDLEDEELTIQDIKKIVAEVQHVQLDPVNINIEAIQVGLSLTNSADSREKLNKMYLLALGFSRREVNEFIESQDHGAELSIASGENVDFYTTSEVAVGPWQDDITHLNTHFAKCDRVLQGISAGEDLVKGFNFLVNCLSNTSKHIDNLERIPYYKKKFKEFESIQKYLEGKTEEVAGMIKKMQAQAKQQAQQQQQEEGQNGNGNVSPVEQNKIYLDRLKVMEKIKRTQEQSQATMERKNREFEFRMGQAAESFKQKQGEKEEMAKLKTDIEQLKAASKLSSNGNSNQRQTA